MELENGRGPGARTRRGGETVVRDRADAREARGVDAERKLGGGIGDYIHGREAEFAPEMLASRDAPGERDGAPEHRRRVRERSRRERAANSRRGDRLATIFGIRNNFNRNSARTKKFRVTDPAAPEPPVRARAEI